MPPARRQQAYYTENDVKRLQARRAKAKKEVFAPLRRAPAASRAAARRRAAVALGAGRPARRAAARARVLPRDAIARADRLTRAGGRSRR